MDDRTPPSQPRRGLLSGGYADGGAEIPPRPQPTTQPRRGLLSGGYADAGGEPAPNATPSPRATPNRREAGKSGGLLSRYAPAPEEKSSGWSQLTGSVRRLGRSLFGYADEKPEESQAPEEPNPAPSRSPGHRDWRATDFATGDLEHWDQLGEAPFEQPPDPDAPSTNADLEDYDGGDFRDQYSDIHGPVNRQNISYADDSREYAIRDDSREYPEQGGYDTGGYDTGGYDTGGYDTGGYDTGEYDTGAYDTGGYDADEYGYAGGRGRGYAAQRDDDSREEMAYSPPRAYRRERPPTRPRMELLRPQRNVINNLRMALDYTAMNEAMNTLAQLSSTKRSMTRLDRLRLLGQRRPAAAGLLALFLVGFLLTCLIPLVTVARLGGDMSDFSRRMADLEQLASGGVAQLLFGGQLNAAQADVIAMQRDLYTINGVVSVANAPLGAIIHSIHNDQALTRIGYDLATAANDGIQVAQAVAVPLEGGILAPSSASPYVTAAKIQQARGWLDDADAHVYDAQLTYQQLDQSALPADYQAGGHFGALLAGLPALHTMLGQLRTLLAAAPALLGVGQPAYYLVIGMNSAQLLPGGGIQSSYGMLQLANGQQSLTAPFSLADTYQLDSLYAQKAGAATAGCAAPVTEPPASAWWWPHRCVPTYGFGLRSANLSPDFGVNAQAAMRIVQATGKIPAGASFQGVIAYTPGLLTRILDATGPLPLPEYNITVTTSNLTQELRTLQSATAVTATQDHQQFSRTLMADLMARLGSLQGPRFTELFAAIGQAIQAKDMQLYLTDPSAEAALQQMGLATSVHTSGDGFFVVDANDGGNEANLYVTETQTDLVTLLPNGDAFHQLAISVTYDKRGDVTLPGSSFPEYSDIQRVYLPGAAKIAGWSGYTPASLTPSACASTGRLYAALVTDCSQAHGIYGVTTGSDTPGRVMTLGSLLVLCGGGAQGDWSAFSPAADAAACAAHPQAHTQTVFLSWTTPHAYTPDSSGHGSWNELVEQQPGGATTLAVYVTRGSVSGSPVPTSLAAFTSLTASAQKVFSGPLAKDQTISYSF